MKAYNNIIIVMSALIIIIIIILVYNYHLVCVSISIIEDMVHSDERLITRIENCNTKTTPIPSTTPTSTSTNDHNDSIPSLSWLDALGSSVPTWNIQPRLLPTEQR